MGAEHALWLRDGHRARGRRSGCPDLGRAAQSRARRADAARALESWRWRIALLFRTEQAAAPAATRPPGAHVCIGGGEVFVYTSSNVIRASDIQCVVCVRYESAVGIDAESRGRVLWLRCLRRTSSTCVELRRVHSVDTSLSNSARCFSVSNSRDRFRPWGTRQSEHPKAIAQPQPAGPRSWRWRWPAFLF